MSVTGRRPSDLIHALEAAIEGVTLRGDTIEVTFNLAADDEDIAVGPRECIDGGFNILYEDGQTIQGVAAPESIGGQVQFKWAHRFTLEFAYDVSGCKPELLRIDRIKIMELAIDLIQQKLNPETGRQYAVSSFQASRAKRHPVNRAFYVQRIMFSVNDYWRRV